LRSQIPRSGVQERFIHRVEKALLAVLVSWEAARRYVFEEKCDI
jgi:hypothetical protein